MIFHRILKITGERYVWFRATASTAVSQLLDSFIVLYIAFVIGPQHWSIPQFLAIGQRELRVQDDRGDRADPAAVHRARIDRAYLGHAEAERLRNEAAAA